MSRLSLRLGVMSPAETIVTDLPPFEEFMVDTDVVQVSYVKERNLLTVDMLTGAAFCSYPQQSQFLLYPQTIVWHIHQEGMRISPVKNVDKNQYKLNQLVTMIFLLGKVPKPEGESNSTAAIHFLNDT